MSLDALVAATEAYGLHHLTASRLPMTCLWWARPDVTLDPRTTNPAAQFGSCLHKAAECYVSGQVLDLDVLAERYEVASYQRAELHDVFDSFREWWDRFHATRFDCDPSAEWECEVAFAFDATTWKARRLPSKGERDYSARAPTEVAGTVDLCLVDPVNRRGIVIDLKTGRGSHALADHREQLEHGALCLAQVHHLDEVVIAVAHVHAHGVLVDPQTVDDLDLGAVGLRLSEKLGGLPHEKPKPSPRDCRYCPGKGSCPVTLAAVEAAAADGGIDLPAVLAGPVADQDHARKLLDVLPRIEAWVGVQRKHLEVFAKAEPVVLDERRRWGAVEKPGRDRIDLTVEGSLAILSDALGSFGEKAVDMTTTKAALERAVRAQLAAEHANKRGALKARMDALLAQLRAAGALARGAPYTVFEAYETTGPSVETKEGEE